MILNLHYFSNSIFHVLDPCKLSLGVRITFKMLLKLE